MTAVVTIQGGTVQETWGEVVVIDLDELQTGTCPICKAHLFKSLCENCDIVWDNADLDMIAHKINIVWDDADLDMIAQKIMGEDDEEGE